MKIGRSTQTVIDLTMDFEEELRVVKQTEEDLAEKKQALGEKLYPLVQEIDMEKAAKITGMIIELDTIIIQQCIDIKEVLHANVKKCLKLLEDQKIRDFADNIRQRLYKNKMYVFRRMIIDGIHCQPVLYDSIKTLNIEAVKIQCKVKRDGELVDEEYSVYNYKYKKIEDAIRKLMVVSKSFKIVDGDLISPVAYKDFTMESELIPYDESQKCSICYTSTADCLECNHHICLKCRQDCLIRDMHKCPECRKPNMMKYYNIDNGLINNNCHSSVMLAMDIERSRNRDYSLAEQLVDDVVEEEEEEEEEDGDDNDV